MFIMLNPTTFSLHINDLRAALSGRQMAMARSWAAFTESIVRLNAPLAVGLLACVAGPACIAYGMWLALVSLIDLVGGITLAIVAGDGSPAGPEKKDCFSPDPRPTRDRAPGGGGSVYRDIHTGTGPLSRQPKLGAYRISWKDEQGRTCTTFADSPDDRDEIVAEHVGAYWVEVDRNSGAVIGNAPILRQAKIRNQNGQWDPLPVDVVQEQELSPVGKGAPNSERGPLFDGEGPIAHGTHTKNQ